MGKKAFLDQNGIAYLWKKLQAEVKSLTPAPVDLSNYVTKAELDEYAKKADVKSYMPFPQNWNTVANNNNKTIKDLCDIIRDDDSAVGGMVFLGGIRCGLSGISGLTNADAVVEIISGTTSSDKVIHIVMTSGNIAPYRWEYTYWNGGNSSTNDWISWKLNDE